MTNAAITAAMAMVVASSKAVSPEFLRSIGISSGKGLIQKLCHVSGASAKSTRFPCRFRFDLIYQSVITKRIPQKSATSRVGALIRIGVFLPGSVTAMIELNNYVIFSMSYNNIRMADNPKGPFAWSG
jgi:hypothetical protein